MPLFAPAAELISRPLPRDARLCTLAELESRKTDLPRLSSGWPEFDQAIGGGFPVSQISECSAPEGSSGLSLLEHQLLWVARQRQQFAGLIDAFDRFDPGSSDPALLDSLLWMRASGVAQAMKAADIVVRDDNFGLLLLDLRDASARDLRRIPSQQWYRLQRAVQENHTTVITFTPFPTVVSARLRISFDLWERPVSGLPIDDIPRELFARSLARSSQHHGHKLRPHQRSA